jgi:dolichyl-phosphate-mannose--protein O-mannosyl transferase
MPPGAKLLPASTPWRLIHAVTSAVLAEAERLLWALERPRAS